MSPPPDNPMKWYDLLYRLYDDFDTQRLRASQAFVDLFLPDGIRFARGNAAAMVPAAYALNRLAALDS